MRLSHVITDHCTGTPLGKGGCGMKTKQQVFVGDNGVCVRCESCRRVLLAPPQYVGNSPK